MDPFSKHDLVLTTLAEERVEYGNLGLPEGSLFALAFVDENIAPSKVALEELHEICKKICTSSASSFIRLIIVTEQDIDPSSQLGHLLPQFNSNLVYYAKGNKKSIHSLRKTLGLAGIADMVLQISEIVILDASTFQPISTNAFTLLNRKEHPFTLDNFPSDWRTDCVWARPYPHHCGLTPFPPSLLPPLLFDRFLFLLGHAPACPDKCSLNRLKQSVKTNDYTAFSNISTASISEKQRDVYQNLALMCSTCIRLLYYVSTSSTSFSTDGTDISDLIASTPVLPPLPKKAKHIGPSHGSVQLRPEALLKLEGIPGGAASLRRVGPLLPVLEGNPGDILSGSHNSIAVIAPDTARDVSNDEKNFEIFSELYRPPITSAHSVCVQLNAPDVDTSIYKYSVTQFSTLSSSQANDSISQNAHSAAVDYPKSGDSDDYSSVCTESGDEDDNEEDGDWVGATELPSSVHVPRSDSLETYAYSKAKLQSMWEQYIAFGPNVVPFLPPLREFRLTGEESRSQLLEQLQWLGGKLFRVKPGMGEIWISASHAVELALPILGGTVSVQCNITEEEAEKVVLKPRYPFFRTDPKSERLLSTAEQERYVLCPFFGIDSSHSSLAAQYPTGSSTSEIPTNPSGWILSKGATSVNTGAGESNASKGEKIDWNAYSLESKYASMLDAVREKLLYPEPSVDEPIDPDARTPPREGDQLETAEQSPSLLSIDPSLREGLLSELHTQIRLSNCKYFPLATAQLLNVTIAPPIARYLAKHSNVDALSISADTSINDGPHESTQHCALDSFLSRFWFEQIQQKHRIGKSSTQLGSASTRQTSRLETVHESTESTAAELPERGRFSSTTGISYDFRRAGEVAVPFVEYVVDSTIPKYSAVFVGPNTRICVINAP